MKAPVKFGGGGPFSEYMERRRRGVAAHYDRKYCDETTTEKNGDDPDYMNNKYGPEEYAGDMIDEKVSLELRDGSRLDTNDELNSCTMIPFIPNTENMCFNDESSTIEEKFFIGCRFYIDGVVNAYKPFLDREPCENAALHAHETLIKCIIKHGGHIEIGLSEYVTHYVVEHVALGCKKWWEMKQRGGKCAQYAVVTPAYIFECHLQSKRLPESMFIPSTLKMKPEYMTLTQNWKRERETEISKNPEKDMADNEGEFFASGCGIVDNAVVQDDELHGEAVSTEQCNKSDMIVKHEPGAVTICEKLNLDTTSQEGFEPFLELVLEKEDSIDSNRSRQGSVDDETCSDENKDEIVDTESICQPSHQQSEIGAIPAESNDNNSDANANEDVSNMVDEYYKRSRLHLLGMWKTRVEKEYNFEPFSTLQEGTLTKGKIFHIDMDAFFVSVAIKGKQHLKNMPLCISYGTGRNSASEIATCNYAARVYGVSKGMWVRDAVQLCPSLQFVKYDFDVINDTAMKILKIASEVTNKIYSASCDELYLEYSIESESNDIVEYISMAVNLAHKIETETECPLSIGIGDNMMLAKLASQRCKALKHGSEEVPTGYVLSGNVCAIQDVEAFIASVSLHELPGVGDRTLDILKSCGYVYCSDIHDKEELKELIGEKLGDTVYHFSRGKDFRNMNTAEARSRILKNKTITSAINYGVRITTTEQVHEYMRELVKQVWDRVEAALTHLKEESTDNNSLEVPVAQIMLKVRVRSPEASVEPAKYMGCGLCDEFTSSVSGDLMSQKSVFRSLLSCWQNLFAKKPFALEDLRGISLGIYRIKKGDCKERNTMDKFLVAATPSRLPDDIYPICRTMPLESATPRRNGNLPITPTVRNGKYQESILSFISTSPLRFTTPVKKKGHKKQRARQLTLYEVFSGSNRSSDNSEINYSKKVATYDVVSSNFDRSSFARLSVVPGISNIWLSDASNAILEERLQQIHTDWSSYQDAVAFYREVFENYASLLSHVGESTTSDTVGNAQNSVVMNVVAPSNHIEQTDDNNPPEVSDAMNRNCYEAFTENEFDPSANIVPPEATNLDIGSREKGEMLLAETLEGKPKPTLFDMRCICKDCRSHVFATVGMPVLEALDCNSSACFISQLKGVVPERVTFDCTPQATTMVLCTLVYVHLLRAVVQLSKRRRFDLLQTFVHYSMRDAASFKTSLFGCLDWRLQAKFFEEAQTYLLKVYNLLKIPSL
ncbi:impB/mucB/samB DNA repair family protein [Babesia bovis T2Bo]|uniref:impB/mucB/samB DNA repair family protein n=1 Tax=Babesia bovis T2Bo TaxID=484906 RepID=UPI001C343D2D|nr:impB/mucB/samB DNA repair family protein [Babesia bovis T2Bo]EDO05141.2 impB/mucB/samB DNA repair family protein [Babesia bovis T2Bo]